MARKESNAKPVRSERLEARISKEQKQLFAKAAAIQGRSMTDFVIRSAHQAAMRTVREYELLHLGAEDRELFVAALLDSTPPGKNLRAAARRYKERKGL